MKQKKQMETANCHKMTTKLGQYYYILMLYVIPIKLLKKSIIGFLSYYNTEILTIASTRFLRMFSCNNHQILTASFFLQKLDFVFVPHCRLHKVCLIRSQSCNALPGISSFKVVLQNDDLLDSISYIRPHLLGCLHLLRLVMAHHRAVFALSYRA